jgi:deoxyribodipyrimidine photo-lyase
VPLPTLQQLGFEATDLAELKLPTGMSGAQALFRDFTGRIDDYAARRDFPAVKGTSYLSAHLRFGTLSIRQLAAYAQARSGRGAATWLSELIWRDFYHAILWHHPRVATQCFKPAFDALRWDDAPELFAAWCAGRTGYPLVDAAMRQLLHAGWMHNRLRMVTASFLTKDLGLDWRRGEAWFAEKLLDFDLAANNGGWQWAASTGCDAQPWFRIFNPVTQSEKFDAEGASSAATCPSWTRCRRNSSTRRGP